MGVVFGPKLALEVVENYKKTPFFLMIPVFFLRRMKKKLTEKVLPHVLYNTDIIQAKKISCQEQGNLCGQNWGWKLPKNISKTLLWKFPAALVTNQLNDQRQRFAISFKKILVWFIWKNYHLKYIWIKLWAKIVKNVSLQKIFGSPSKTRDDKEKENKIWEEWQLQSFLRYMQA